MITDLLVEQRRLFVLIVVLISVALVPFVLRMRMDRTLKSAYVTSSAAYYLYKYFIEAFGTDEFVLVAIKGNKPASDSSVLKVVEKITGKLESLPEVDKVISIINIRVSQKRNGILGNYPLVRKRGTLPSLPEKGELDKIRNALPMMDYLISDDMKTTGIMILINDRWKFDPHMADIQKTIASVVADNVPAGSEFRMLGAPVIREAVQEITLKTTIIFGILCAIIIALVTLYIFKSFRVAGIATVVVALAVHWIVGLMSILGIPLNSTTSLCFGLVLVVAVATVIHIVTHYYHASKETDDREQAAKMALRVVGRPALMCSLTTSIAFATIMISSIPMVRQLGLVMSVGVLMAFILSIILTPAFLIVLRPVDRRTQDKMSNDWISRIFEAMESFVFQNYRFCAYAGILLIIIMVAGAPRIKIDTQILGLFVKSSNVLADIRFAEENLTPVHALEVVLEGHEKTFKDPEAWRKLAELDRRLLELPQVVRVDSPLPLFTYLNELLAKPGTKAKDLLSDPRLLSQVMLVMTLNAEGKKLLHKYVDQRLSRIHISVRIKNTRGVPIGTTIQRVEKVTRDVMKGFGKVIVTGEMVVFSDQASEVVRSQVLSLLLAFTAITLMMIIQFRSYILGVLSLIPNLLPIAVIFGLMGWVGIALDNVTVFAATIAIGLSVDDTIHYLTQLKRDMTSGQGGRREIKDHLRAAYQATAKALISTSVALFLGFLALSLTPTRPAIYFGFLGAAAILAALLGDLVLMPAVILTFKRIRSLINTEIYGRELAFANQEDGHPTIPQASPLAGAPPTGEMGEPPFHGSGTSTSGDS
jgi:predicted RND superfamily exporter protein